MDGIEMCIIILDDYMMKIWFKNFKKKEKN